MRHEPLSNVTLRTDGSSAFSLATSEGRFFISALAAGTTRLTATATTDSGEQLNQTLVLEARRAAHHSWSCVPSSPAVAWLPGQVGVVTAQFLTDSAGARLEGEVDYQATGPVTFDWSRVPMQVTATGPGEVRLSAVEEAVRQVTPEMVIEVASAADVDGLQLASTSWTDAGEPLLQPSVVTLPRRTDGSIAAKLLEVSPLFSLTDGGRAWPDLSTARLEDQDGGVRQADCREQRCSLFLAAPGHYALHVEAGARTLTAELTAN